jgi:C1A family cysteine protease
MKKEKLKPRLIKWYGWRPDTPDKRDHIYSVEKPVALPPKVDLRSVCPQVYDQGNLGSCTANAIAAALQFDMIKQKVQDFVPSRLFIYYNERVMEGTVNEDAGAEIRDGIKSVVKLGDCPEKLWSYNIKRFAMKPSTKAYTNAMLHQALQYSRIMRSLDTMKQCLASGFPFVFGFMVYESFESKEVAATGVVPMPADNEQALGGHAVMAVGYNDEEGRFYVRNSWGEDWGIKGYFTMPYEYLANENLSDDFWSIKLVE